MKNNKNSTNPPLPTINSSSSSSSSDSAEIVPFGFIFLCNNKTKPRCFQYQVFGLSISQKRTVEKIKPGTKLFLFDYEMRLLHGVFEAVSNGKLDVEPRAFHGKYLAQVKFRIIKDCFPLEEKYFKSAILDNYRSGRLRLELSEQQVNKLVPLFHVFRVPAAADHQQPITTVSNSESSLVMMPRNREMINDHHQQYDDDHHHHHQRIVTKNLNFMSRWLHDDHDSLQILQQNQYPMAAAGAIVDHHHSIPNLIHHVQEPFHPRNQITGEQQEEYWLPPHQNQITATTGMANDHLLHQLSIITRQQPRQYSPHPHQEPEPSSSTTAAATTTRYNHQLPFLGENNTMNPNYSNLPTIITPYDHHQIPYLVSGPALQPLIHNHHLPIGIPAVHDHSTYYSMAPTTTTTTLVWPHQQNYSCPLPISLRRWLEPNINVNIPQISTAGTGAAHHHLITMQSSHAAAAASFNYSFV